MGKIKIKDLDKKVIKEFLHTYKLKVNKSFIKNEMLTNLVIIFVTLLLNNRLGFRIVTVSIGLVTVGIYISFIKGNDFGMGKICLYHGIYADVFCLSLGMLGFQLLRKYIGSEIFYPIWIFLYVFSCILIALITYYRHFKKLYNNMSSLQSGVYEVIIIGPIIGIIISTVVRSIHMDIFVVYGIGVILLGITFSSLSYFFLLSYCYSLIERKRVNNQDN